MKRFILFTLSIFGMITQLLSQTTKPTLILVHGGWHGAWCWHKVLPLLKAQGINALAIDLPGHGNDTTPAASVTLDHYVQSIVAAAGRIPGPVMLVGHSSGGTPIAQAAEQLTPAKVAALVFLDAFMPQDGESVFSLVEKFQDKTEGNQAPALAASMQFSPDQKTSTLNPDKVAELLYHDCSADDIAFAKARLGPQPLAPQATPVHLTAQHYGVIPKFYILCTEAKDFNKTRMATNVACQRVYRLASSHSPFFSMPGKLVAVLDDIYRNAFASVAQ